MLETLLKLFPRKVGFGVYVAGGSVYVSKATLGSTGFQVEEKHCLPLDQISLRERLLETVLRKNETKELDKSSSPIVKGLLRVVKAVENAIGHAVIMAIGLADTDALCTTFAISAPMTDLNGVISENPQASFLSSPDLSIDFLGASAEKQRLVLASAANKMRILELIQLCDNLNLRPIRIEPGRWAALRAVRNYAPTKTENASEIRILLGNETALAVVLHGGIPLVWGSMDRGKDENSDQERFCSLIRRLLAHASRLHVSGVSQILFLGDAAVPQASLDAVTKIAGSPACYVHAPPYDGHLIATGLAIGALDPESSALNLARLQQKSVYLFALFPRAQAASALAAVVLVLALLRAQTTQLENRLRTLKWENKQETWAYGKTNSDLALMNEKMLREAQPLDDFLTNRVPWALVLEDVAGILPPNSKLKSIALSDMPSGGKGSKVSADSRSVILQVSALGPPGGGMPRGIADYWMALKNAPTFGAYFPVVQLLSSIQLSHQKEKSGEVAWATASISFTPGKTASETPSAEKPRGGEPPP